MHLDAMATRSEATYLRPRVDVDPVPRVIEMGEIIFGDVGRSFTKVANEPPTAVDKLHVQAHVCLASFATDGSHLAWWAGGNVIRDGLRNPKIGSICDRQSRVNSIHLNRLTAEVLRPGADGRKAKSRERWEYDIA